MMALMILHWVWMHCKVCLTRTTTLCLIELFWFMFCLFLVHFYNLGHFASDLHKIVLHPMQQTGVMDPFFYLPVLGLNVTFGSFHLYSKRFSCFFFFKSVCNNERKKKLYLKHISLNDNSFVFHFIKQKIPCTWELNYTAWLKNTNKKTIKNL